MRLANFIEQNVSKIVDDAEVFARSLAPDKMKLTSKALRDDIPVMLGAIVEDLRTAQTSDQHFSKSLGHADSPEHRKSAAHRHGRIRAKDGFDVNSMIAEFRALRASVLKLWIAGASHASLGQFAVEDIIRFNEAVDQAVAESMAGYSREVNSWRHMFLGVLGHDLRGPLTAIVMTSNLLTQKTSGTPLAALSERIEASGKRMGKLLDNLLDYNKAHLGIGMRINASFCDLDQAIRDEIDMLRAALPTSGITFTAEGPTQGIYDASRIREALHNLVTNAAKYGEPREDIRVSLVGAAQGMTLTVCNMGPTLAPDTLSSIFEPMRRGTVTALKGEEASLGLGLFVVREIVLAHGGKVTASSENGMTQFILWLPNKDVAAA